MPLDWRGIFGISGGMLFWIVIAIATALVALVLLYPLTRGIGREAVVPLAGDALKEQAVYRDQLKEVERDQAEGLISAEDADYARAEIGRRLLAATQRAQGEATAADTPAKRPLRLRLVEVLIILALPGIGVPLYLTVGSPGTEDQPLEARLANPGNNLELLLAKVERHLMQSPDDAAGWALVAPIYAKNQMVDKAADAYRNLIRLKGASAENNGALAEALIQMAGGRVDDAALAALQEGAKAAPNDARIAFYLALRLEQDGKRAEAFAAYKAIRDAAPKDAVYLDLVNQHVASSDPAKPAPSPEAAPPGNPTAEDMAAAQGMSGGDRQQMIMGMVQTLDARLQNEPDNFEGWMRLVRSYAVLDMKDKSADALARALKQFPADTDKGKQLIELAAGLGIRAEGGNP